MVPGFWAHTAAGGGGSNPPSTNLQFWFKADAITGLADGASLTTTGTEWLNSATGGSFTTSYLNAGTDAAPVYHTTGFNGLPKVSFTGASSQWMQVVTSPAHTSPPSLAGFSAGSVYIVCKVANDPSLSGNSDSGFWHINDADARTHHPYTDGVIYESWGTTARKNTGNPATNLAALHLYCVTSATNDYNTYINGTLFFNTATNTTQFDVSARPFSFGFSIISGGQSYMDGDIAEILIYDTAHGTTDRQSVETYLNGKWAIY